MAARAASSSGAPTSTSPSSSFMPRSTSPPVRRLVRLSTVATVPVPSRATHYPLPTTGKMPSATTRGILKPHEKPPATAGATAQVGPPHAVAAQVYCMPTVRVGNWRENELAAKAAVEDLVARHLAGELGSTRVARRVALAQAPAALAPRLAYGVPIMLQHLFTLGMLNVDVTGLPEDQLSPYAERQRQARATSPGRRTASWLAPASPEVAPDPIPASCTNATLDPTRRNVLELERVETWDGEKRAAEPGEPICYGDKFFIKAKEIIPEQTLYLHATSSSSFAFSKYGKNAPATFLPFAGAGCLWQFVTVHKPLIVEHEGLRVEAGHRVVLQHCLSSNFLFIDPNVTYRNDFGVECEVAAKRTTDLTPQAKAWIQFVVWVDDPSLVEEISDIDAWQRERQVVAAGPRTAALPQP
ncbi:hypothetical protein GGF31_008331 [Allomyces arbusculus]|nr:hypothetical protein GGF31_008331 [Allomyces arbusculus]